MKTITLTAFNRVAYLAQMLESLRRNDVTGYHLMIAVEPGYDAVLQYCHGIRFMPTNITVNPRVLGVTENPYALIEKAFACGSEFNIALEDDLVLAPDTIRLAEWYRVNQKDHHLSLCLFNYASNPNRPSTLEERDHFSPLGWATHRFQWATLFSPEWRGDPRGWDFSINALLARRPDLKIVTPTFSRTNHLGRCFGTHCSPAFHDQTFGSVFISTGQHTGYSLDFGQRETTDTSSLKITISVCFVVKERSRQQWNRTRLELFPNCISSLQNSMAATDRIEIVVADFGSPDWPLEEWLYQRCRPATARILKMTGTFSRGKGRNRAAKSAKYDVLFFLDCDIVLQRNTLLLAYQHVLAGRVFSPVATDLNQDGSIGQPRSDGFGILGISKAAFNNSKRWPEFTSWGGEDTIFYERLCKTNTVVRTCVNGLFHQWHPEGPWKMRFDMQPAGSDYCAFRAKGKR